MRDSYAFGVIADNFLSSVVQTGTAQVRVTVEDVNDETPVFGLSSYSATVPERTSTDTLILTVTATDDDLVCSTCLSCCWFKLFPCSHQIPTSSSFFLG